MKGVVRACRAMMNFTYVDAASPVRGYIIICEVIIPISIQINSDAVVDDAVVDDSVVATRPD